MARQPVRLRGNRGFRRFWTACTISDLGSSVTTVALGVLIVSGLGGTAVDVGVVRAAGTAPYLVIGVFAGVLVDRVRRRPLLVGTDLGCAVVLIGIPMLAVAGLLTVAALAALMAVFGVLSVLSAAAQQSFLPRLTSGPLLHRANVRLEQSTAVAQATGPLVGGGLVAVLGAPLAIVVDAASFAVSGLLIAATTVADPRPAPGHRPVLADLRDGVRWVYHHPTLRGLALATHAWFLFHAVATTAYLTFALIELRLDPLGLGATFAAAGAGAVLGTSTSEAVSRRVGLPAAVAGSRVLEGVGLAAVTAAVVTDGPAAVLVAAVGQFLYGVGMGVEGPVEMSYRQAVTPDRLLGRTNATMRSFNRAAVVVGAPLGGLFADTTGPRPALWLGAAGLAGSGVYLARSGFSRASPRDAGPP